MWFTRALRVHRTAFPVLAASGWLAYQTTTNCEEEAQRLLRKRATVAKASASPPPIKLHRTTTEAELSKIRGSQAEIFQRWELDEEGWRELPSRAWPEFQPNPEQLVGIELEAKEEGCDKNSSSDFCQALLFSVATGMVFYNVDPPAGLKQFEALAKKGHVDSMVAVGVILTEGLGGIRGREQEGLNWLRKAVSLDSTQGMYELGTLLYTGMDEILYEDPEGAYEMFQKAAAKGHVGASYMTADCLIEGEGTDMDVARAIPLLYAAADQGHRYARQRIRELLKASHH